MHDFPDQSPPITVRHRKEMTAICDHLIGDVKRWPIARGRRPTIKKLFNLRRTGEDDHRLVGELEGEDGAELGGPFGHLQRSKGRSVGLV
jgi:hypothetical protein